MVCLVMDSKVEQMEGREWLIITATFGLRFSFCRGARRAGVSQANLVSSYGGNVFPYWTSPISTDINNASILPDIGLEHILE